MVSYKFIINGIVQGVGFRPFIFNAAIKHKLFGIVYNDVQGVIIEVEGNEDSIIKFEKYIISNLPPRAKIFNIKKIKAKLKKYKDFKIINSNKFGYKNTFIPSDSALCEKCKKDLIKQAQRKNYPFTNCVDCGPRFTITNNIPFDRENTTMSVFKMCKNCKEEYESPENRRFHSQTNCCKECGPHLILLNHNFKIIKLQDDYEKIKFIAKKILEKKIVAIKGIGGFHIAALPFDDNIVLKLRKRKIREDKPLALMAENITTIKKYAYVNKEQIELLKSSAAPIVVLKRKVNTNLSRYIFQNLNTIGFMLPYTPLHYLLLKEVKQPLIMTSGNISEEPIICDNDEVKNKLKNVVDYFLLNNREIFLNCDDSVVSYLNNNKIIIRRSRGYVPQPFLLNGENSVDILAVGAEEKNTFAIVKKNELILSHHIGDLKNYETFQSFKNNIQKYFQIYEIKPDIIVADKHPDYLNSKYAAQFNVRKIYVQHHYAHLLSLFVDRNLNYNEPILCFTFDGTGFGDDGNIWGGEILLGNAYKYKRVGHLEYLPLVTPELAIKEPIRIAICYLSYLFNHLSFLKNKNKNLESFIMNELKRKKYLLTSSIGRLFDFIAYICGVNNKSTYSGQLPIEFEALANEKIKKRIYKYEISFENEMLIIKVRKLIENILIEILNDEKASNISTNFHWTLVNIIFDCYRILSKKYKIKKVGFSGGVFQNQLLIKYIKQIFKINNLEKYLIFHNDIPANDGGIAAGQALFAFANKK
ncbi:MAG TPA: carbamoyltransferase HypF [bacterium]|nr:carbamoyltransferase HypF [bacterium]HOL47248.1 carbamoyltransferase HypF [bacterium]HPQ19284.1 carbamoyltransferase HypF [bacterium]